jgi:hypothetical protein
VVELDITSGSEQVSLIEHERGEPALPEVPPPALAEVDRARVAPVRLADGLPQLSFGMRSRDQVDMIQHQAIGPDLDPLRTAKRGRTFEVRGIVLLAEKRLLATIAALNDVVGNAWNNSA